MPASWPMVVIPVAAVHRNACQPCRPPSAICPSLPCRENIHQLWLAGQRTAKNRVILCQKAVLRLELQLRSKNELERVDHFLSSKSGLYLTASRTEPGGN